MGRRFVIGIDELTAKQKQTLRNEFGKRGSWWNWIPNLWLVTTVEDKTTAKIRDRIGELAPGVNCMVFEVDDVDWSGFGPNTKDRSMFRWLNTTWPVPDDAD
jgi:hypothetical protein